MVAVTAAFDHKIATVLEIKETEQARKFGNEFGANPGPVAGRNKPGVGREAYEYLVDGSLSGVKVFKRLLVGLKATKIVTIWHRKASAREVRALAEISI